MNKKHTFAQELINCSKHFFQSLEKHVEHIWKALGSLLSQQLGDGKHKEALHAINLIKFFLDTFQLEVKLKQDSFIKG
jgi:hypothetical protein